MPYSHGHFPQKSPIISSSFAKTDLQLKDKILSAFQVVLCDTEKKSPQQNTYKKTQKRPKKRTFCRRMRVLRDLLSSGLLLQICECVRFYVCVFVRVCERDRQGVTKRERERERARELERE